MEGCAGCFQSQKSIDQRLSDMIIKARTKAKDEQKPIAIIIEAGELQLMDAWAARLNNYQVKEIVSHYGL
jgi:hypothetical protein